MPSTSLRVPLCRPQYFSPESRSSLPKDHASIVTETLPALFRDPSFRTACNAPYQTRAPAKPAQNETPFACTCTPYNTGRRRAVWEEEAAARPTRSSNAYRLPLISEFHGFSFATASSDDPAPPPVLRTMGLCMVEAWLSRFSVEPCPEVGQAQSQPLSLCPPRRRKGLSKIASFANGFFCL